MSESYWRASKEAVKTTQKLKKKGLKAIRINGKTVIFVKQDADEEEAKASYKDRIEKFNMHPVKWKP